MPRQQPDALRNLEFLLTDLCADLGFCGHLTATDLLPPGTVLSAVDFAQAVLRAEKMTPEYELKWTRQIQERFESRFGASLWRGPA